MEDFASGTMINNKYKIITLLGKGSMGRVYLVENLKGERFVIKELLPDKTGKMNWQESLEIFRKEAHLMMNFIHPGLPQFFETFSWDDREFLVMEFIEGITLETVISDAKAPLEINEVIDWIIQLCHIMDYLHNSFHTPIVYRDLKPSNIILTNEGKIKLVDFGIARYYNPDKNTDTLSFGTPGYAAPEQYKGKGQSSPLSDIFGLGVIMYQLLTLYDPTVQPFTFPEMKKFNPSVPDKLEKIIKKALSLNPLGRYISMNEFRETLERYIGKKPVPILYIPLNSPHVNKRSPLAVGIKLLGFALAFIFAVLPLYFAVTGFINTRDELFKLYNITMLIGLVIFILWIISLKRLHIYNEIRTGGIIEVFIVYIITLVMGFLLTPGYFCAKEQGQLAQCKINLKNLAVGLEMYATDNHGYYPENLNKLENGTFHYMKKNPSCPVFKQDYGYEVKNGNKSSNFTLYCPVAGCHRRCGLPIESKFPQYSPVRGIITK